VADRAPEGPVHWYEPNAHSRGSAWSDAFFEFAPSVEVWLLAWLDGQDIFDKLVDEA
jgi:hypothetical protein